MPGHFYIMIDKSTLQGLSPQEAEWLFHHFRVNMPPVLFHEIIGDLGKTNAKRLSTGTGVGDVKMLASKIDDTSSIDLNETATRLVESEIMGYRIVMDGRPVIGNARRINGPRGSTGLFVDQTPMQEVMARWRAGDFEGMEKVFSEHWRNQLKEINLESIIAATKKIRVKELNTAALVMQFVDGILNKPNSNHANLLLLFSNHRVPNKARRFALDRWIIDGRPSVDRFTPYAYYVAKLEFFFHLAVAHHIISTRASNLIDMEYFKYLPFTKVFTSGDNLHRDLFPVFAQEGQIFISRHDLKSALAEISAYYAGLEETEKSEGSYTYADFPPVKMDNAITRAYDAIMPRWREGANQPQPARDPDADRRILDRIRPMIDAIRSQDRNQARRSSFTVLGEQTLPPGRLFPFLKPKP